jgi:hypothetical protein
VTRGGIAKSMPIRRGVAGDSCCRSIGWIYKGVQIVGVMATIPTSAICLHMDRDSSSIEHDPCQGPALLIAQGFPGLHISMCTAQRHVQPVTKQFARKNGLVYHPEDSGEMAAAGKVRRREESSGQLAGRLTYGSREGGVSLRSRAFIFWISVFR